MLRNNSRPKRTRSSYSGQFSAGQETILPTHKRKRSQEEGPDCRSALGISRNNCDSPMLTFTDSDKDDYMDFSDEQKEGEGNISIKENENENESEWWNIAQNFLNLTSPEPHANADDNGDAFVAPDETGDGDNISAVGVETVQGGNNLSSTTQNFPITRIDPPVLDIPPIEGSHPSREWLLSYLKPANTKPSISILSSDPTTAIVLNIPKEITRPALDKANLIYSPNLKTIVFVNQGVSELLLRKLKGLKTPRISRFYFLYP